MDLEPYHKAIPYGRQCIEESDIEAVARTLRSDFVAQGPEVAAFEEELCEATGARYAVAVSSGTAALHLCCAGFGLGPSDTGLVPGITFAATANCLRYVGAAAKFVDVDPLSGLASAAAFAAAAEGVEKVGALLPVSFSGAVADLEGIARLGRELGAVVIEDAAHSLGATYGEGVRSASCQHGDAAILSFHPVKHICAGEGGAVLTNDPQLADRVRRLRSHGIERGDVWTYDQSELGFHYRMTDLQAALGRSQLRKLPHFLERRRELAARYRKAFEVQPFASRIRLSDSLPTSALHLFLVHFASSQERAAAYAFFHAHNVKVQVHYLPVYQHSYYRSLGHGPLPGCESFYGSCLSLPLYPDLGDDEQDYVIRCLEAFLETVPTASERQG